MQSNNGDLYFRAGIDLDGFNAGATAMEKRMETASSNVVSSAGQMDDAISKIGGAFTRIVGAGAAAGFVKQMFNVRSEMQNTEAMLRVFLGSTEKAAAFLKQMQGYAYNNVFEFKDLAAQSAQMLAYGNAVETVIPTINKLSEVAAGTNVPLEELVGIWNKVKVTDKMDSNTIFSLGAKGINVRQAIADIKELETGQKMLAKEVDTTGLKFKDLQKIIDHVASNGGMFDGMMQEKMKTLGDSFGLMQDNLTNMFNEIGEKNQGLLKGGMDVANYLIENYESVAKVLGTLVVAYGTAKAASIAFNIAQKNGTGVAVLDNTVWAIRGNLLKVNAEGGKNITASIRQITAEQKEEIATLKAAITEQEHEEVIRKSRTANLGDVLTATQKARLEQMGLNEMSADYVPIAMSMLDKEQQMVMAKAELSNNNAKYIDALRDVVGMHGEETNSIDDRIEAATRQLAIAEKEANAAADAKEQLEKKVEIYKDYYEASLNNIDATDLQERQEALETAQSELEAAAKAAETASETRNTAQKKLNELQTKKNAIAEGSDTAATQANATAKNILSVAVGKLRTGLKSLWAVMSANPLGAIFTAVTVLVSAISFFKNKAKETEENLHGLAKATDEANKKFDEEKSKVDALTTIINDSNVSLSLRKKKLAELKEIVPDYHADLTEEGRLINNNTSAISDYCSALEKQIRLKAAQEELEDAYRRKRKAEKDKKAADAEYERASNYFNEGSSSGAYGAGEWGALQAYSDSQWVNRTKNAVRDAEIELASIDGEIQELKAEIEEGSKTTTTTTNETVTVAQQRKKLLQEIADLQKKINKATSAGASYDKDNIDTLQKQLKEKQTELQALNGGKNAQNAYKKASDERKKYLESLSKEEAMLIFDAEDAKIAAMQDGAEKEMATMQNNFNRQMTELDFERREIDKKRKEAKLPAINWEETDQDKKTTEQLIDEQKRHALEDAFDRNSKKVFDNEIEQRKKDYETYVKWVENVGQDAADRQYEKLIEKGRSFSEFVDNEIARLEEKSGADGLTDAELNYLDNLKAEKQRNQSQSYASMEEEMSKEIATATTLAEKLEIINRWLEKIKGNGDNSTSKDNILWKLSQQRTELLDEMNVQFNQTYERYAQKRLQTEREINRQISELNKQHRYAEANALKASLEQTLQELDTDFLKGLVSTVFKNPTKKNMREAMSTLQAIQNMTLDEFNGQFGNGQFQLTEEQFEAIKGSIGDVNTEIKKLGQGYTLADAFKDIRDGRIDGDLEKVARGTEFMQNAFSKFASVVSTLSGALDDLAESSNNASLKKTADTVGKIANVISSGASMAAAGAQVGGGWGALIGAVLGLGTGTLSEVFKSQAEKEERVAEAGEKGLEYQQVVVDQLLSILGAVESLSDTVTSLNYEQYRSTLIQLINELQKGDSFYSKGYDGKKYWNYIHDAVLTHGAEDMGWGGSSLFFGDHSSYDELPEIWKKLVDAGIISLDEALNRNNQDRNNSLFDRNAIGEGGNFWQNVNNFLFSWLDHAVGTYTPDYYIDEDTYKENTAKDIANYLNWIAGQYEEQQRILADRLSELYNSNSFDSLEYFNAENDVYKSQLDELKYYREILLILGEDTTDIDADIKELEHTMGESLQHMTEGLFGVDIQSLIEDWISIFQEFGDNVDGAFAKIDDGIDKMIANMLLKRNVVEPLLEQMSQIFTDYAKEVGDDHEYTEEDFRILGERLRGAKGDAYEAYQRYMNALEAAGISIDSLMDNTTMTGSLQNLSEETGGVIAGRLNAMVINQAEGNNFLRQSLLVQYEMRNSLQGIQSDVATIKQRMNSANAIPFNPNVNYGYSEMAR